MATKTKPAPEAPKNKRIVQIWQTEDEDPDEATSKTQLSPEVTAALNIQEWDQSQTVAGIRAALTQQIDDVANGCMRRPEAMLLSQAHSLDTLFNSLAQSAHRQTHAPHFESFLRLALKAQGQCRTTLETLAAIKNPPVIFAKQANINNGNQQINNGVIAPQAEKIKNKQNELLTELPHETLDSGRTSKAIGINSDLEALG